MTRSRRALALAVVLACAVVALGACDGKAGPTRSPAAGAGAGAGVTVTGSFGEKPTLGVPAGAPPGTLRTQVLHAGSGPALATGQTLVANYLGETWDKKDGQADVFDNSYDGKVPVAFPIGSGAVLPGWDKALVGQRIGSRVLLSVPPALGYGASPSASSALAGHTLLFVIDLVGAVDKDAASSGTETVGALPAGLPSVRSQPGRQPAILSVHGVKAVGAPLSGLLVRGDGTKIDPTRSLALQIVETDLATGKQTEATWGKGVDIIPAAEVIQLATVLKGQNLGSRAVAVTPPQQSGTTGVVLIVDVIAQF